MRKPAATFHSYLQFLLSLAVVLIFLHYIVGYLAQIDTLSDFELNKFSKQGSLPVKWKFHEGDDPRWAERGFDDSKWEKTDPAQDITQFEQLKKSGVGWIRLHIVVDSATVKKHLTAWVYQFTASEIYLDGKLIKKYGSINSDPAKTKARSPADDLFDLKVQADKDQVIAVRLGYESNLPYCSANFVPLPAFVMFAGSYMKAHANAVKDQNVVYGLTITYTAFCGIFLIISFIYLIYYLFDKHEKTNLYYFIYSALTLCFSVIAIPYYNNIPSVPAQMWTGLIFAADFIPAFLFLLLTVYALFQYQPRNIFKLIVLAGIGGLCYMVFIDGASGFAFCANGYIMLTYAEGVRVCIWAMRKKKKNAAVVMAGIIPGIIFSAWALFYDQVSVIAQVINLLSAVTFPLGMAFYLGIQNALTNKKLRTTLVEVQRLSEEKQQILSDQNEQLERQVSVRTAELNQSLNELKSTQSQLIQREKMASLGELTAGIAHEIQNPLNFVNNFSEVNTELLEEMALEIEKGDLAEVKIIAGDIRTNQEKICQHGKRADFIVKGMLQHSRTSTGEKQLTNMNALCDEFLKLSYHGMRAKDKSFNAETITNFDPNLPKANVVQQDFGRVMLNLVNNAFYAVNEKAKTADPNYKPLVQLSTAQKDGHVEIKVKDNGSGFSENIKEKIFQPFFTTKPTGQGTGLGLSLSYDIVVKEHGGNIAVSSTEGEGSEFVVSVPLT
jgi:signal transduction histidine kinase